MRQAQSFAVSRQARNDSGARRCSLQRVAERIYPPRAKIEGRRERARAREREREREGRERERERERERGRLAHLRPPTHRPPVSLRAAIVAPVFVHLAVLTRAPPPMQLPRYVPPTTSPFLATRHHHLTPSTAPPHTTTTTTTTPARPLARPPTHPSRTSVAPPPYATRTQRTPTSPRDACRLAHQALDFTQRLYSWPGLNWRPSACEADIIATRPQLR